MAKNCQSLAMRLPSMAKNSHALAKNCRQWQLDCHQWQNSANHWQKIAIADASWLFGFSFESVLNPPPLSRALARSARDFSGLRLSCFFFTEIRVADPAPRHRVDRAGRRTRPAPDERCRLRARFVGSRPPRRQRMV